MQSRATAAQEQRLRRASVALGAWVASHNTAGRQAVERREHVNLTCPGSAGSSWQTRRGASSWAPWIWHLVGSAGAFDWPYHPPVASLVAATRMVRLLDRETARLPGRASPGLWFPTHPPPAHASLRNFAMPIVMAGSSSSSRAPRFFRVSCGPSRLGTRLLCPKLPPIASNRLIIISM